MAVFEIEKDVREHASQLMAKRYEMDRENFQAAPGGPNYALLQQLTSDNFNGGLRLYYGGGLWVAPDGSNNAITLSQNPYDWVLRRFYWPPVNRWGENIFMSTSTHPLGECWQNHNPDLTFWNYDNQAQGDPQDLEHFHFEYVDSALGTVRIRDYQNYVYFGGKNFGIGASPDTASSFYVQFDQGLTFNMLMNSYQTFRNANV
jgi:hypothetical protein